MSRTIKIYGHGKLVLLIFMGWPRHGRYQSFANSRKPTGHCEVSLSALLVDCVAHDFAVNCETFVLLAPGLIPFLQGEVRMGGIGADKDVADGVFARNYTSVRHVPVWSEIEKGRLISDHVHMPISIAPRYGVGPVVGFTKGKSAIHIAGIYDGRKKISPDKVFGR